MVKQKPPAGMQLGQVIAMLMAAKAQGAKYVQLAARTGDANGVIGDIDWISPSPVNGVAYIGALQPMDEWPSMDNRALEALDW